MPTQLDLFEPADYHNAPKTPDAYQYDGKPANRAIEPRKLDRGYSEIIEELKTLRTRFETDQDHKNAVMAEAISWGYHTARTNRTLESRLYRDPDLRAVVIELAAAWNGDDYLNGSLYIANRYYLDPIPYTR